MVTLPMKLPHYFPKILLTISWLLLLFLYLVFVPPHFLISQIIFFVLVSCVLFLIFHSFSHRLKLSILFTIYIVAILLLQFIGLANLLNISLLTAFIVVLNFLLK